MKWICAAMVICGMVWGHTYARMEEISASPEARKLRIQEAAMIQMRWEAKAKARQGVRE